MANFHNAPKLPKAFQRPSIELDRFNRVWRDIYPEDIEDGDTLADWGTVEDVIPQPNTVRVMFVIGRVHDFPLNDRVFAFTAPGEQRA